jgi:two-component system nitrate/nitrite response regulator NarL
MPAAAVGREEGMATPDVRLAAESGRGSGLITVLAADRHPLFREGLVRAIRQRPALQLVDEVADGRTALECILRHDPDIAVVDADLRDLDGSQVLNAVIRDRVRTRVLLVSAAIDPDAAYRAIAEGAAGVLSKRTSACELCGAVDAAAAGEVVLAPAAQTGVAAAIRRRALDPQPIFSEREQQILLLVAEGQSAAEIGRELYLSTGTVKGCLLKLYERLGVSERAAAVAAAMRRGLIE